MSPSASSSSATATIVEDLKQETEKQFVDLLTEEPKLQDAVSDEHRPHMDVTLAEAKRAASQYQKEAGKCNAGEESSASRLGRIPSTWENRSKVEGIVDEFGVPGRTNPRSAEFQPAWVFANGMFGLVFLSSVYRRKASKNLMGINILVIAEYADEFRLLQRSQPPKSRVRVLLRLSRPVTFFFLLRPKCGSVAPTVRLCDPDSYIRSICIAAVSAISSQCTNHSGIVTFSGD
ncbi:hypothetical protein DY000_02016931 [Brassica cretica]|uniref:Uncharacterized protein n=1 Tax=Brassica cretica TaxID=69181 RepID=A0ABQ7D2X2_BRACR|nr:hypothetical protein DY000_02016931 [Brassica cretica]